MASGHRASTPASSGPRRPAVPADPSRRPASASAVGLRTVWSLVFWLLLLGGVYVAATRLDPSRVIGLRQAAQEARASAPVSIRPDAPMLSVAPAERPASVAEFTAKDASAAPPSIAPPGPASEPTAGSTALAHAEPGAASTPERFETAPTPKAPPPPSDTIYKCVEGGRVSFSQGVPCAGKAQRVELTPPSGRRAGASTP
jgi:hypothetical protein